MFNWSRVIVLVLGTTEYEFVVAGFVLVLIGAVCAYFRNIFKGVQRKDNGTPNKIDWSIVFCIDNVLRWIFGVILALIFMRLTSNYLPAEANWIAGIVLGYTNYDLVYYLDKLQRAFLKWLDTFISRISKLFK